MRPILVIVFWAVSIAAAFFAGRRFVATPKSEVQIVERTITITNKAVVAARAAGAPDRATADGEAAVPSGPIAFADARAPASTADASAIFKMKDAASRAQAFAKLLAGLSPQNARAIMEMFLKKGFKNAREEEEIRMLAETWASIDGRAAADFMNSIPHDQRPQNSLRATLAEWATRDLDAAEAWARAATTNVPNHYMIGVIAGAANVDLSRAEHLLYEMPYGRERGDAMAYVAGAHLENGNSDAMSWAQSVPDERLQQASIRRVASQVALTDPMEAANWVVKNSNEDSLAYNVSSIAKQWSYADVEAAVNWAFSLPPGDAQNVAVSATLPRLASSDPAAAEKLLLNQPASKATDPARIQLVKSYSESDPVRAIAWANTVTDPRTRDHVTQRVMESWQKRDPQAAAQFMQPKVQ